MTVVPERPVIEAGPYRLIRHPSSTGLLIMFLGFGLSSTHPPEEPSSFEQNILTRIKRATLFVFLRHHRHELFDDAFQEELATLYAPSLRGRPPIPPAQLALATIVQANTGASDDEVIEATLMDRRWQLVLDCLDTEQAPWSQRYTGGFPKAAHRDTHGSTAH